MQTLCVDPDVVEQIWPHVSHWIEEAYQSNDSDETFEQTENAVLNKQALLWIAVDGIAPRAAAVTKIWGDKRVCSVLACGGSGDDWPLLLKPIENYATDEGCFSVRLEGRKGWARLFKEYSQPWITLEKKLRN